MLITAFVVLSCQAPPPEIVSMETAEEIGAVYAEARNTPNLDLLDTIFAADAVIHDCSAPEDIVGLEALKAYYQETHTGFPDFTIQIDEVFPAQNRIVVFWTIHGTHTGDLRGMPPTGSAVSFSGVAIDRLEGGLIVEEWVYFNMLDLLQQLGMQVVPPGDA